ncbi:hypothetical protein F5B22DRAFT_573931 [Xylaria bambusicola]|uniref:uncharacterized protein n=1 Tax=Xylaria bambusicola TaxID=326684 RepID=UPI0020080C17|nr:uncharacterized protein F5B22DRAFT_573931 [Xylaria bambusicola]KAI0503090.1 hypothetical protein F5B22DRAFT_573931 [Xylaria bambusicola]
MSLWFGSTAMAPRARSTRSNKRFADNHEYMIEKIQQRWGIEPAQLFSPGSCQHPRVWTLTLLADLVRLAEIAPLEQVTKIFERGRGPITKEVITSAVAECLRTGPHATPESGQPNSPSIPASNAHETVYVRSEPRASTTTFTPADRTAQQSCPQTSDALFPPIPFALLNGCNGLSSKRRKLDEHGDSERLEVSASASSGGERPNTPQCSTNTPLAVERAPQLARDIGVLISGQCQDLDTQYNQQRHQVEQTSRRLEAMRTEETRLLEQRKELKHEEDSTMADISAFEEIVRSKQEVEDKDDQLVQQKERLEASRKARKSGTTPPSVETSPCQQESEVKESRNWSLQLADWESQLTTITGQRIAIESHLHIMNGSIATAEEQLEEEKETVARTGKVVTIWNSLSAFLAESGALDT